MFEFDQSLTWRMQEAHLATLTSDRQRAILQTVIDHGKAEAVADVDGLMKTLVDEPEYRFWGPKGDTGPKGYKAVRSFYENVVKSGGGMLSSTQDRIIVSENSIA